MAGLIAKLTEGQKAILPEMREKWLRIGLSTERIDGGRARDWATRFYTELLKRPAPALVLVVDGPVYGWIATLLLAPDPRQVKAQVREQVWEQVGKQVQEQVREQVWEQVHEQVGAQVREQVGEQVREQVREQVWEQVWEQVGAQVGGQARRCVWPYVTGSFLVSWLSFYETMRALGVTNYAQGYDLWREQAEFGCVWPLQHACIFAEKPTAIHMREKRLHQDGGPSVEYADGLRVWSLNGVRVPQWLAETRDMDIDPREVLQLENVEQRREGVRKVGVERIAQKLGGKSLDRSSDETYELLRLTLGDGVAGTYLKMLNPSIGVWHMEGVPHEIQTVQAALAWRNGTDLKPEVLT